MNSDNPLKTWLLRRCFLPATLSTARLVSKSALRFGQQERLVEALRSTGLDIFTEHFYRPIPLAADMTEEFWSRESELVGVDLNEAAALALMREVLPPYVEEFGGEFPLLHESPAGAGQFHLINGAFMAVDAHLYYSMIRHHKPARVVEVGAGNSTMVAAAACRRNAREGRPAKLVAVEPYPSDALKSLEGLSELHAVKVQQVGLELFESLGENDILFIDSSHTLREGGDVQFLYCEVLPRLAPGALAHIHDISLPKPYPRAYYDRGHFWNEQYLLQAFLTFNRKFSVLWPGAYMMQRHAREVAERFPGVHEMLEVYPQAEPSSFWMRTTT